MLDEMTWTQFVAWQEYANLEPFGEERSDLRSGIVASVIANSNRDPKRQSRPFKPSDFMPQFQAAADKAAKRVPLTDASEWEGIKAMARAVGGARQKGVGD